MLVGLFRKMNPISAALTILPCLSIWLIYFSDQVLPGKPMPLYELLLSGFTGNGRFVLYFMGVLLILAGAAYINFIINQYDASEKRSYLPGLLYAMIMCLFPEWILFHPMLIVNIVALHILAKVLRIYREPENLSLNFDIGLFVALATFFYFPAIYLLLFFLAASFTLRPFYWRDWASALVGLLLPYFLLSVYYFITNRFSKMENLFNLWIYFSNPLDFDLSKKVSVVLIAIILVFSFISIANYYFKSITVTRKTQVIVLVFLAVMILIALLTSETHPSRYTILAAPLAITISYYLLNLKNRYIADSVIVTIFLLLVFNHIYLRLF